MKTKITGLMLTQISNRAGRIIWQVSVTYKTGDSYCKAEEFRYDDREQALAALISIATAE